MTKRFKTCILHIGTEKTGTSTIQKFLDSNRKALLKENICYPETPFTRFGSQWEFVAIAHPYPWTMDAGQACEIEDDKTLNDFKRNFKESLQKQFSSQPNTETLLISSEHFHSRLLSIGTIKELKDFLNPWVEDFKIIIYFRRQDKLAVSYYTTQIKSGSATTELYLPSDGPRFRYFDYKWIYRIWREVFEGDELITRLYNPNPNIGIGADNSHGVLQEFCNLCNIDFSNKKQPAWLNQSVDAKGLGLIHGLHKYNNTRKLSLTKTELAMVINQITRMHQGKFFPITRSEAENFYKQFKEGNEFVRKKAFPDTGRSLFDTDFSHYPDKRHHLPLVSVEEIQSLIADMGSIGSKFNVFKFLKRIK